MEIAGPSMMKPVQNEHRNDWTEEDADDKVSNVSQCHFFIKSITVRFVSVMLR